MSNINFSYVVYKKNSGLCELEFKSLREAENYIKGKIEYENVFGCHEPDTYEIIRKVSAV